ncbi:inovirus-type Gp2 protein [Acinetobacter sichuanensis]|uniref:YagK/YfjJ domain-containing protein n=1 Tax=Acinetobacter sichuanensis TaxID=2136183 RepID=UPI00280E67DE|nr:inovirus-type Gp2 protein [Acinetobacter sichuanensis]MDQ9023278.1 inovirus-type Gp2 protein [Acinetobacter sichuanensis]
MTKPSLNNSMGTFSTQDMIDLLKTDLSHSQLINQNGSMVLIKHPTPPTAKMCFDILELFNATRNASLPIAELKQCTFQKGHGMYTVDLKKDFNFSIDRLRTIFNYHFTDILYYGIEVQAFLDIRSQFTAEEKNQLEIDAQQKLKSRTHAEKYATLLNRFFKQFQDHILSSAYKKKERDRKNTRAKNKTVCINLFKSILARYSKVLVIRIDFSLKRDIHTLTSQFSSLDEVQSKYDLKYIQSCMKRFKQNRRHHSMLKKIEGYIFQYEYSFKTGFHIHAYFFFNGNEHQKDISIAQMISDYWKKLTNDQGCTFICNMKKEQYKHSAIGMIHYSDQEKQQYLFSTFDYICKADQFFVFSPLKKQKTFQCSQPLKRHSNAGRPRQYTVSTH